MWYQSLGLNGYYSLSPGYMSIFVVVTLHQKTVITSVAKRIWQKKISKADLGDILHSLNHHDGIAYLADGENLFTGAKLSLVFSFVPSVQQLDPHPKALFLGCFFQEKKSSVLIWIYLCQITTFHYCNICVRVKQKEMKRTAPNGVLLFQFILLSCLWSQGSSEQDSRLQHCFSKMNKVVTYKTKVTSDGITQTWLLKELPKMSCMFNCFAYVVFVCGFLFKHTSQDTDGKKETSNVVSPLLKCPHDMQQAHV